MSTKNEAPAVAVPSTDVSTDVVSTTTEAASPAARAPGATTVTPATSSSWLSWGLILGCAAGAMAYGVVGAGLGPSAPLVFLTLGGAALAFCGMTLYRVLEPLVRPAAAAARAADSRQSARLRELEREKQLVLKAIREIEHDFQMRKISEADHKELTHRYRTRALRLIREIDAGDDFRGLIEQELKTRLAALAAAPAADGASPGNQVNQVTSDKSSS